MCTFYKSTIFSSILGNALRQTEIQMRIISRSAGLHDLIMHQNVMISNFTIFHKKYGVKHYFVIFLWHFLQKNQLSTDSRQYAPGKNFENPCRKPRDFKFELIFFKILWFSEEKNEKMNIILWTLLSLFWKNTLSFSIFWEAFDIENISKTVFLKAFNMLDWVLHEDFNAYLRMLWFSKKKW